MSHSFLTGINLFSCSFSASARLWQLPLSPAKHSISWMVPIAAAQLYRLLTKAPRIFNASSKRRAHQPCITQLIRKQNVMQNLSVRRTHPGLPCLDHRGSCIALSSSPKYSVLHNQTYSLSAVQPNIFLTRARNPCWIRLVVSPAQHPLGGWPKPALRQKSITVVNSRTKLHCFHKLRLQRFLIVEVFLCFIACKKVTGAGGASWDPPPLRASSAAADCSEPQPVVIVCQDNLVANSFGV